MSICAVRPPVAALCFLAVFAGCCGQKRPFDLAPANGKITYTDGTPIDARIVKVFFVPENPSTDGGKHHVRPAETTLAEDGRFAGVSTISKNDGVIPGTYRVVIEALNADTSPNLKAIAMKYRDARKTPLEVIICPNVPNVFALTVEQGP